MELQALVLLVCLWSVHGYPSRPLNDRPGELAWQAWLLVDSQNQATEGERRITPKSVFIAPRLGTKNDSLPDCADGYQPDQMGRCIKFVKVDQAAHLNFLLQRLNAVYATKPDEDDGDADDDSSAPTSGPLQLNIPLGTGFSSGEEPEPDPNPEIAIIVAPTNGNFDVEDGDAKVSVKRTHVHADNETSGAPKPQESQSFLGDRGDALSEEEEEEDAAGYDGEQDDSKHAAPATDDYDEGAREESSTKSESTSTQQLDGNEQNTENIKEATTTGANEPVDESTEQTTTTTSTERTGDNLQALFFLVPISNATHVQNNRTANATGTPITSSASNSTPLMSDTEPSALPIKAKPDTETQPVEDLATLIEPVRATDHHLPADLATRRHLIRFPSNIETHSLTNDDIDHLFQEFLQEARNPQDDSPYRKRPVPRFPLEHPQIQRPSYDVGFNHRNRDRNSDFWKIPPEPREESSQKPLVLRFERHPTSNYASRYNTELYYPQDSSRYYEETTRENIPIIFPSRSRRNHFR